MPNQPQALTRVGAPTSTGSGGVAVSVGPNSFVDLKGRVVRLSPEVPPGYPANSLDSGFIGSRKRSWTENAQQCWMYANSVNKKRVQAFNYFHFARLEGKTVDGREQVYSWVSGWPGTKEGTGDFVVYSTINYLRLCGFRPK